MTAVPAILFGVALLAAEPSAATPATEVSVAPGPAAPTAASPPGPSFEAQSKAWRRRRLGLSLGLVPSVALVLGGAAVIVRGRIKERRTCAKGFCEGTQMLIGLAIGVPLAAVGTACTVLLGDALARHARNRPQPPGTAWLGKRQRVAFGVSSGGIALRW